MLAIMLFTPSMASAEWSNSRSTEIAGTRSRPLCAALRKGAHDSARSRRQGRCGRDAQAVVSDKTMKDALETLKGKPKVKRTMWSRRAQEYEAKINSGDLTSIAEVTRDLFRADDQPEQSYSERQIFEAASSRLARELAAMEADRREGGAGQDPRDFEQGRRDP